MICLACMKILVKITTKMLQAVLRHRFCNYWRWSCVDKLSHYRRLFRNHFPIRGIETKSVSIISSNPSADLALLKLNNFDGDPAKFSPVAQIQMAELFVYGSSRGTYQLKEIYYGIVSSMNGLNDDMTQFQMTAPVQPGNSGGPVLNRNGNVLGVVVATANQDFRQQRGTDTQNINFAIHGEITKLFGK